MQYLERHAEPEIALVEELHGRYQHVLVVPAYDEHAAFLEGLWPAASRPTLCIVVVNASVRDSAEVRARTVRSFDELAERVRAKPLAAGASFGSISNEMDVLLVDRARRLLPAREGVGLARKIGCDIALALHARGRIAHPWIHMTDADARLPTGYFDAATNGAVALAYPFVHAGGATPEIDRAHADYEVHLRYYVLGLAWAGSRYAHHSIGSTIAVEAGAYAAVRGVPPRRAGEDFYLLNKLRKLGAIAVPDVEPIVLRARRSARVPFGTGRAVLTILDEGREQRTYDPRCFSLLRSWLTALDGADPMNAVDETLVEVLDKLGARDALAKIPASQRLRRRHEWFDGFRTLKLLHGLRDAGLPSLPWREALARAPFVPETFDDPFAQCRALAELERLRNKTSASMPSHASERVTASNQPAGA